MEEMRKEAEKENKKPKNHVGSIENLLTVGARFGDGPQKMAAYANAVHEDDGVVLAENPSLVLTTSKVQKARERFLTDLSNEPAEPTTAIFTDGKKFATLHNDPDVDLGHQQSVQTDDHYVFTDAERQTYLGETTVARGTGQAIGEAVIDFVEKKPGLNMDDICILGGDSTNANVGKNGGFIAVVERITGRTFHRFICVLHLIELLLRHVVGFYVGDTSGPCSFSSELGKALTKLKNPVIAAFKRIPCPQFPEIPENVLAVGGPHLLFE